MSPLGIAFCSAMVAFVLGTIIGQNSERNFAMRYPSLHAASIDARRERLRRKRR